VLQEILKANANFNNVAYDSVHEEDFEEEEEAVQETKHSLPVKVPKSA